MGRIRFVIPTPAPKSPDEALAALTANVTTHLRGMGRGELIVLFDRLKRDKKDWLAEAGLIFIPAAKEALTNPKAGEGLQSAAAGLLLGGVPQQPVLEPKKGEPGYKEGFRRPRELAGCSAPRTAAPAGG